jgi:hypothetical protein
MAGLTDLCCDLCLVQASGPCGHTIFADDHYNILVIAL